MICETSLFRHSSDGTVLAVRRPQHSILNTTKSGRFFVDFGVRSPVYRVNGRPDPVKRVKRLKAPVWKARSTKSWPADGDYRSAFPELTTCPRQATLKCSTSPASASDTTQTCIELSLQCWRLNPLRTATWGARGRPAGQTNTLMMCRSRA